ncbi:MAG: hypothetical protein M1826_005658 [Phylliscum demangeonii]|nr:MAG: hypothetical protein M1826_005658 [Phylliscum demangeonii]
MAQMVVLRRTPPPPKTPSPPATWFPPATPSPTGSSYERRFHLMHHAVEHIELYRPGGYHPVHMDEVFNNRYRVIRKLGYGMALLRCVEDCLKIVRADASEGAHELSVMIWLDNHRASAGGAAHVIELQDSFTHQGPNGTHLCLVLEVMGASLNTMGQELACLRNPRVPGRQRDMDDEGRHCFPVWMTKVMLRQVLLAVEFLHRNDIVRADLQSGNMLCSVNLHGVREYRLRQDYHGAGDSEFEKRKYDHYKLGLNQAGDGRRLSPGNDRAILGHLPEPLFQKWARADRYFGPVRKLLKCMIRQSGLNDEKGHEDDKPKLDNIFHANRPAEMSEDEERPFLAFLRDMLQYDPSKRPSASDLLQHPCPSACRRNHVPLDTKLTCSSETSRDQVHEHEFQVQ